MLQAGVIRSDYATLMVEILKDNARQEAGAVYGATRRTDRAGLPQISGAPAEVRLWY
jgi:hypothetical protein